MLALGMKEDHEEYRELTDADIRPFAVTHYEKRRGDRKRTPSWIWKNSAYVNALPDGEMKDYVEESECDRARSYVRGLMKRSQRTESCGSAELAS